MKRFILFATLCLAGARLLGADTIVLSEFMAANSHTIEDEDRNYEDWIEVMNLGAAPVNLAGWRLTDDAGDLAKWVFPATNLAPNQALVVFASNKDRRAPGAPLHTNFRLSNNGEYLALVRPDGSIATEFAPAFPRQAGDVSYGLAVQQSPVFLVATGSPARVLVPSNDALGTNWIQNGFDDSGWHLATNGLGFQRVEPPVAAMALLADSVADFSGTQGLKNWHYGYWDKGGDADGVYAPSEFVPMPWNGSGWAVGGNPPWTQLWNNGGHPNKEPQWHYAIRRWVSPVQGLVRLVGYVADGGECGDGVDLRIFVDGIEVYTTTAFGNTREFGVNVTVAVGTRVDFAVGPNTANDWCDGFNFAVRILQGAVADSVEDWSTTGQQGARGWSYGYYDKAADADGIYQANNFTTFTPAQWQNGKWDLAVDTAPWTELTSTGGHPASSPGEQWAIRRWTSSHAGKVLLSCRLAHPGGCGGGTKARIYKDGQLVDERAVSAAAVGYFVPLDVSVGTILDFAIDPNGDDGCDSTAFMVRIQDARTTLVKVADAEADWVGGVQGANNWYYGYYDRGADADGVYNPTADYRDNSTDPAWVFDGQWHRNPAWPPWTSLGPTWGHPNGYNSPGGENWTIQRWVSEVSGPISIAWNHRKQNGGGGTTILVFKNGELIGSTVVGGDFAGQNHIVTTQVATNDLIDFALTPVGPDATTEDWADGTQFNPVIYHTTESPLDQAVNTLVADSIADWSPTGEQGYRGWSYGLYNLTGDADGVYQPSDFVSVYPDWNFTGSQWELGYNGNQGANPPWNTITQTGGHPNGTNNSAEVWSIRRWTSTFSGSATITWRMAMIGTCGGGTSVRIFHNGAQLDFAAIAGNDTTGISRTVVVPSLAVGDVIDIALTPVGAANGGHDGCDSTAFSASIYRRDTLASHYQSDVGERMHQRNASLYARFPFAVADPSALDRLALRVRYDDGFVAYLNGVEIARRNAPSYQAGGLLANSLGEFSGTQGANNWFHGFYDKTADLNGVYETSDFSTDWNWTGSGYGMSSVPPWTSLSSFFSHPNGANSGHEQWTIRRWVCETAGALRVNLRARKDNPNCGNGVTLRVFHNGAPVYSRTVEYWDTTGFSTNLTIADAQVGDLIDIALDATGADGAATDPCDGSAFAVTIDQEAMPALAWNSRAAAARPSELALVAEEFDLTAFLPLLVAGNNVLAVHGLNASAPDLDFLLVPELTGLTIQPQTNSIVYFTSPTPGGINGLGTTNLGPIVSGMATAPRQPLGTNDLLVTARATATLHPVGDLKLIYRVMYGPERELPMFDDGAHGDGLAGDGVWGATIPVATEAAAGQMVRWYFVATDSVGNTSREPAYLDPNHSPQYYGTMVADPAVVTPLPVLYWFVQYPTAANSYAGTRCSIYYNGEFYDNVRASLHGQSTTGFPKKSYNFDLNPGHHLRYAANTPDLEEFVLFSTYADKTHLRNVLAYDAYADTGVPAHFAFPVRVQQNGQFHSLGNFAENANSRFLERLGLNPYGALYKLYNTLNSATSNVEKKTRRNEDHSDLQSLINNLNQGDVNLRKNYLFDHLDIAEIVNYLATRSPITGDNDWGHKNFYLYRDTLGSGEWQVMPQDVDLSFGHNWTCGTPCLAYFDDNIYTNIDFYAGYNVLFNQFKDLEPFRSMWLRRVRTLMDTVLQPPGTPLSNDVYHTRMHAYAGLIAADAALDFAKWNPNWGTGPQTLAEALARIDASQPTNYLPGRRAFLFHTLSVDNGGPIPHAQSPGLALTISAVEYNPASGNQDQEYVQLTNPNAEALDISGWRVAGAIRHTFKPGTVIPAGGSLYLVRNAAAFRARAVSPKGGEQRFVQGNYEGQLSARGETVVVLDQAGQTNALLAYPGTPSLPQQFLRITELMYHPAPLSGATNDPQDFAYLELRNISGTETLDLTGVHFASGIEFSFTGSAVTSLAPGQRVLVVKNAAALAARYGSGLPVAGEFAGNLDRGGERITLLDAANEEILDFTYRDSWYPLTDGAGFSLVVVNEAAEPDAWNWPAQWRPSGVEGGSPGAGGDALLPAIPGILINEALTHTDLPAVDAVELYNPTAGSVDIGGWFLTDDFAMPKKYRIPDGTVIPAGGYLVFDESQFNPLGLGFALDSAGDQIYLFSGDADTNVTGYYHGFAFGAAANGVSFGRHVNSQGAEHFVAQSTNTLLAANAPPLVGPLVFNQIMYHPPGAGTNDNTGDEYLELMNISDTVVALYDPLHPTNTWRLRGGVDFDFPPGVMLAPNERLWVVNFDPNDLAALAAFRARYSLGPAFPIFGPYGGNLANAGERLELQRPDAPAGADVPYILVEAVEYANTAPWPASADGLGLPLQRLAPREYGNDPANWIVPAANNHAPVTFNYAAQIVQNQPLVLVTARLLGLASDPDGDPLMVLAADLHSTNGGSVVLVNGTLTYTPVADFVGNDQFGYVISDGRGGTALSVVRVIVTSAQAMTPNIVSPPQMIGANFHVKFAGIPGRTYLIQAAPGVTGPWSPVTTLTGGANGLFELLDPVGDPPPPARFYRAIPAP